MKIKILKEIKGTFHTLKAGEVYNLPHSTVCKKTKRKMDMQIIESERWEAGFFLSFGSSDNSSGCGFPLKLNEDFEVLEIASACTNIPSASTGTQINLF